MTRADTDIIILAAGRGTRMKSRTPKVLHRLAGRSLLAHVIDAAASLAPSRIVVVTGHEADAVEQHLHSIGAHLDANLAQNISMTLPGSTPATQPPQLQAVLQQPQLGTGHAVMQALPAVLKERPQLDGHTTLILCADVPLIQPQTLADLLSATAGGTRLAVLTVELADATGYGRIVRNAAGSIERIVEHKDASAAERLIGEINTGIMAVPTQALERWLPQLKANNAQGEFYLTDIVALARAEGMYVAAHTTTDAVQVQGINSPAQLAELERAHQLRMAAALLEGGTRLADPARLDVRDADCGTRADLRCAQDVEIDVGCIFTGRVILGEGVKIGAYCHITNAHIEADTIIAPFTHIEGKNPPNLDNSKENPSKNSVYIGQNAHIGPFARLRPGANLGNEVHMGNFVEIKNAQLAHGAKANHLAYIGDATIGENVNYGAGSITANYDGANKHRTIIGANTHIGSNCVLVAPVEIGQNATIGAGSTITKAVPDNHLALTRGPLKQLANWQRPSKK